MSQFLSDSPRRALWGVLFMLACVLLTAMAGAATKHVAGMIPVTTIVCLQYLICLLIQWPLMVRRGPGAFKTDHIGVHFVRSLGGWLCFLFYYLAIDHVPLVDAALLRSASPLCVPLVIWAMTFKAIPLRHWIPLGIGFAGVALVLQPETGNISQWHFVGFLSAVFLAVSMVLTRKLTFTEPGGRILFYYFLISFLCGLPLMLFYWQPIDLAVLPYVLFISVAIYFALQLYTLAYTCAKATVVSPFSYFGVVFAGLLGWFFWGHVPDWVSIIGMLLVVLGGIVTVAMRNP